VKKNSLLKAKDRERSFMIKKRNQTDFFVKSDFIKSSVQKERYCTNCGELLSENLKFCFYCSNTTIPRSMPTKEHETCPDCGAILNPEVPSCPKCDKHIIGDISQPY